MISFHMLERVSVPRLRPAELADWLMGRGKHFATTEDVSRLLSVEPTQVRNSLRRQREANKIVSVSKGGVGAGPARVSIERRPSPADYIDPLMEHLGHPYYVGFLSAAQNHGASHQSPMVFQVVTPAAHRNRTIGGCRIQFIRRAKTASRPTERCSVSTGRINISTAEVTVSRAEHRCGTRPLSRSDRTTAASSADPYQLFLTER